MIILRQKNYSLRSDSPNEIKLDNGLVLKKVELGWLGKLIGLIPSVKRSQEKVMWYDITIDGKKIGDINFCEEKNSPDAARIEWIGVKKNYRGNHYATEVLKTILDFIEKQGYKKVTLDAVGDSSPDAHHIYEKLGFKDIKVIEASGTGVWGGLTEMTKEFSDIDCKVKNFSFFGNLFKKEPDYDEIKASLRNGIKPSNTPIEDLSRDDKKALDFLDEAYNEDYWTLEGGTGEWVPTFEEFFRQKNIKLPSKWVIVTGDQMNKYCNLKGSNAYKKDFHFLSAVGLDLGKVVQMRLWFISNGVPVRWMGDIISNNKR